ncbi:AAA family ATPase [Candidatus Shapirobacteria bacterium]|nr:MAG: AAA family ATPase [Candidatus Shapirobacteria bacterium]
MIKRSLEDKIKKELDKEEVLVLYGPRQAGKTTLLKQIKKKTKKKVLEVDGDLGLNQKLFSSLNLEKIKSTINGYELVMIDEAQRIENIGLNLKIIHDNIPNVKIIATGSSSFELSNKIREPLTGRAKVFMLYPVSIAELKKNNYQIEESLENYLLYGMYPKVLGLKNNKEKITYLQSVVEANLYKDILELDRLKNPKILKDLLVLLAFQLGKEVSLNELSKSLAVARETVVRYLDLLEKAFIIIRLGGFSRNLRKEVIKNSRYYFMDIGIRNALINNFNSLDIRNDVGMLWENFLLLERMKLQHYNEIYSNNYFWRTYDQKEIDLIEERDGKLWAYEFKWGNGKAKGFSEFLASYKNSQFKLINRDNFLTFLGKI